MLNSLYAKLGTDYGLLKVYILPGAVVVDMVIFPSRDHRSVTPFYSTCMIRPLLSDPNSFKAIREDSSKAAEAIRSTWKCLGRNSEYEIDVLAAAADSPAKGLTRRDISRKLHDWEM